MPFLPGGITNKLWLLGVLYLVGIFSEVNEVNLSLQGKQLIIFVANDGMKLFCNILNFGKLVSSTISLRTSWYLDFSEEVGSDVNGILEYCIIRHYLENLPNLRNWYFPNDQCMSLQNPAQIKIHSKYNMDVAQ